jgi:cob(I)alamin adenosyltransferase
MKIYTGTGDRGKTGLFSGERLLKCDPRLEANGDIDELNSIIGAIQSACEEKNHDIFNIIASIQAWLLDAGAWLTSTSASSAAESLNEFSNQPVRQLEMAMDAMSETLPVLRQFVLPQGHLSASLAHVARTVCRRTERHVIAAVQDELESRSLSDSMANILVFLNRLSDYLFVLARYLNTMHGHNDILWKP